MRTTLTLITLFLLVILPLRLAKSTLRATVLQTAESDIPLYLPEGRYVKLLSLGYDNFLSDILWFTTINYFGKQYHKNADYKWLYHRCDLVTQLDPRATPIYEFCGTLLSWMAKEPEKSNLILNRAIETNPNNWRYPYLRGFNYWYFLEDKERAATDMATAAKLPGAPPLLASLATRLLSEGKDPRTAVAYLSDMVQRTADPTIRAALLEKLRRAQLAADFAMFDQAIAIYNSRNAEHLTNLEQLVTARILNKLPEEPFGGKYVLDTVTGKVNTTSGQAPLTFGGKTATSGIMRDEFVAGEKHEAAP